MTEVIILESKTELINRLRKQYNVPDSYKVYVNVPTSLWATLKEKFKVNLDYQTVWYDELTLTIVQDFGYIKGKYFLLIYTALNIKDGESLTLFTDDIQKFHKEYLYKQPIKQQKRIYPAGFYKPARGMFGWFLDPVPLGENGKPILNDDLFDVLKKEIQSFRQKRDIYNKMKLEYKRGILLMGSAGNGKTSFIKHLLNDLKHEAIGIICNKDDYDELDFIKEIVSDTDYNEILKILVMEDIDGMDEDMRSVLLNFLDGVVPIHNTIIISTTNFPDRLDIAIKNRPSRFDSVHHIGKPNAISREKLLRHYFPNLKRHEMNLAVKESKGFSGAYFKEIYVLGKLNDLSPLESIKELKRRFSIFEDYEKRDDVD